MIGLPLALKAAPYVLIALLVGALLYMRADIVKVGADRDKAQAAVAELAAVNAANAKAIEEAKQATAISEQSVKDLNATVTVLKDKLSKSQSAISKVLKNDPKSKAWADLPVPDELRGAIN